MCQMHSTHTDPGQPNLILLARVVVDLFIYFFFFFLFRKFGTHL